MKIGYARISTNIQDTALQIDALELAGCEKIYQEQQSGSKRDREQLQECLKALRTGDILICWRLDRLGRSLGHLIEIAADLEARGVGFQSVTESLDSTTPAGRMVFHFFGAIAQFERDLIKQRVNAGLAAARKRGVIFGRREALSRKDKEMAIAMAVGGASKKDIAETLSVCRQTIYKLLKEVEEEEQDFA